MDAPTSSSSGSAKRKRVTAEGNGNAADWIECPVCMELMTGTINQCAKGHTLCGACTARVTKCPSCRCNMDKKNPIRNLIAERMVDSIKVPCEHEGCSEVVPAKDLKEHMAGCEHGPYKCPTCEEEVAGAELWGHIKEMHKEYIIDWEGKCLRFKGSTLRSIGVTRHRYLEVPDGGFVVVDMAVGGKLFPSKCWSDARGCFNVCVRQVPEGGSPPKMVTVHLLHGDRETVPRASERCRQVMHCFEAQSMHRTPQEVLDAGDGMSVGLKELEKMYYRKDNSRTDLITTSYYNILFEVK